MTLRCLFVDFNAFFASVEQLDRPQLRGRPIAVVPVMAETTCCIAASYEAKAFGIRTGTAVGEALARCPEITLVLVRPARYVEIHHQAMAAIADCIPHGEPESIDEVPCWLLGRERERANAEAIAQRIKRTLHERLDGAIRCSIGIAPNKFLAKTASDMQKPDGLTVIELADLPHALHRLELRDLCGIGPSIEHRLRGAGIRTVEQLCAASRQQLRLAWGSVEGDRFWMQLRGHEVAASRGDRKRSIGHSHVLGPELRSYEGARAVAFKLLAKAAMRLRREGYRASGLAIRLRMLGLERRFERDLNFAPLDDTPSLLQMLGRELDALRGHIERGRWDPRRHPPLSVAVTLVGLEPADAISGELIPTRARAQAITRALDAINRRYGNNAIFYGAMAEAIAHDAAPMRIPFQTIPEPATELDAGAQPPEFDVIASADELMHRHQNQFRVLAERTHRQSERTRRPDAGIRPTESDGIEQPLL
jgi:DNA polymerase-4